MLNNIFLNFFSYIFHFFKKKVWNVIFFLYICASFHTKVFELHIINHLFLTL